jgi:hypothetical protein
MVSVFPESPLPLFPPIELLSRPAGDQLHGSGNYFAFSAVKYEQMNVVRCGYVVENSQPVSFLCFKEPGHPRPAVFGKF